MIRSLLIFLIACLSAHAQIDSVYYGITPERPAPPRKERNTEWLKKITYGGNFHGWLGNPSFIFLSPSIGYVPVEEINIGAGLIYNYLSTDAGYYGRYTHSIFGGHSYLRYI